MIYDILKIWRKRLTDSITRLFVEQPRLHGFVKYPSVTWHTLLDKKSNKIGFLHFIVLFVFTEQENSCPKDIHGLETEADNCLCPCAVNTKMLWDGVQRGVAGYVLKNGRFCSFASQAAPSCRMLCQKNVFLVF